MARATFKALEADLKDKRDRVREECAAMREKCSAMLDDTKVQQEKALRLLRRQVHFVNSLSEVDPIPPEVEKPFRRALEYASKRRTAGLHAHLDQLTGEQLSGAIGLCGLVGAYVAITAADRTWPTDAALHGIARKAATGAVTERNLRLWLSRCALGGTGYADVFGGVFRDPLEFTAAPFLFAAGLLAAFQPEGTSADEFLSLIERAYEGAALLGPDLLPALMVWARRG